MRMQNWLKDFIQQEFYVKDSNIMIHALYESVFNLKKSFINKILFKYFGGKSFNL